METTNYTTCDTDELLKLARSHDMEAAEELIGRVTQADFLLTSTDCAAKHFRIGAGHSAMNTLRETVERVRNELQQIFRLSPIYRAAGF